MEKKSGGRGSLSPIAIQQEKSNGHNDVGKGHQVDNARIDAFGNFFPTLLDNSSAHGALGSGFGGQKHCRKREKKPSGKTDADGQLV